MKFHFTNLETCHEATGVVVVIDVIRAFTNHQMGSFILTQASPSFQNPTLIIARTSTRLILSCR
jgi:hypothetical protein